MKKIILTLATITFSLLSSAQWTKKTDVLGGGKNHFVTFTIDSLGYAVTGLNTNASLIYSSSYKYDPSTDTWSSLANFPGGARGLAVGGSYNGKGYIGFGVGTTGYYDDLWEYSPDTDTWKELATCPCFGRRHPVFSITSNGKIFVGLGDGNDQSASFVPGFKDWWEYDISTDTWTQKTDLPAAGRHHPYFFAIGTDVYAGFGDNHVSIFKDFYKYNSVSEKWTTLNDFPGEARVAGGQFTYDGHGYIVDGEGSDHRNLNEGELHKYYPATDSWEKLAYHSGDGLWASSAFVIDSLAYVVGGDLDNDFSLSTLWAFSLEEKPVDSALTQSQGDISMDSNFFDSRASFQWVDCNNNYNPLPGETSSSINIPQDEVYALIVTYSEGGKDTSDCYSPVPVSVQENKLDLDNIISVYPNPVKNILKIEKKQQFTAAIQYSVVNILGMEVKNGVFYNNENYTLDVSALESGIYLFVLRSDETAQKVIKIKKIN